VTGLSLGSALTLGLSSPVQEAGRVTVHKQTVEKEVPPHTVVVAAGDRPPGGRGVVLVTARKRGAPWDGDRWEGGMGEPETTDGRLVQPA